MSLAAAWREPEAWQGSAMIRGTSTPARVLGLVVLDEMVVHGWDIAVAAGRIYEVTDAEIEALIPFVSRTSAKRDGSLFGPVVEVPPGASPLDRLLGLAGRDPSWKPAPR